MWIRLKSIPIFAFHGAHAHEKKFGNKFEIDVEIEANLDKSIKSDSLKETIDYAKVLGAVQKFSEAERYNLLETWATRLAEHLCIRFPLTDVCLIRIRKHGGAVGGLLEAVEIEHRHTNGPEQF
jgi:dihydroneopterin aldolase